MLLIFAECTIKEFQCANGYCVHKSWLCNDRDDCGDNSDEVAQLCFDLSELPHAWITK